MVQRIPDRISFKTWLKESDKPYGGANDAFNSELPNVFAALRAHNATDFRILGDFTLEEDFGQRMTEGAWPIQFKSDSKYVVIHSKELKQTGLGSCLSLFSGKRLTLVHC